MHKVGTAFYLFIFLPASCAGPGLYDPQLTRPQAGKANLVQVEMCFFLFQWISGCHIDVCVDICVCVCLSLDWTWCPSTARWA